MNWNIDAFYDELRSILDFWLTHTCDHLNGGFVGRLDNDNTPDAAAPKGVVLNARILWSFSAGYACCADERYRAAAERSFDYLSTHFVDHEYGGVYWTVDPKGRPLDTKKQIYALAFAIYGLSEYYAVTKDPKALSFALDLYTAIETYSHDKTHGGYLEAFAHDWRPAADVRLSEKDANEKKTMNTHLHIIEAYANLYRVAPTDPLKAKITSLLDLFDTYFIDKKTFHLKLFFDETWTERKDVISYGHDIEAAWLLLDCAGRIEDANRLTTYRHYAVKIADAAMKGLDKDGGLWYEYDPKQHKLITEKHWWPQAEAVVGFFNAWQLSGDDRYFNAALNAWLFINEHLIDWEDGEWFWGVREDYTKMAQDKVGPWKCPYHNARACIELIKRKPSIIN